MKKNPGPSLPEAAELRRRAEARLQEKLARTGPPTAAEALRLAKHKFGFPTRIVARR
jgi:hypothetical protein